MLSICIPIYQLDVRPLVQALLAQVAQLSVPAELVLMDDGSGEKWIGINRELGELSGVSLSFLPANIGRAAIRNRLAEAAKFPYLLFLDNDAEITEENFLQNYVSAIQEHPNVRVICGGRVYQQETPEPEFRLHWRYGRERESQRATIRQAHAHRSFMTNNFLIFRELMLDIRFDERLKQYGHEDTLFGFQLSQRGESILHLDNPVQHQDLATNADFLHKTEQGIQNLVCIWQDFDLPPAFAQTVTLLKTYEKVKAVAPAMRVAFRLLKPGLRQAIASGKAPLRWFDAYKLLYLAQESTQIARRRL